MSEGVSIHSSPSLARDSQLIHTTTFSFCHTVENKPRNFTRITSALAAQHTALSRTPRAPGEAEEARQPIWSSMGPHNVYGAHMVIYGAP